jgi:hypothetical protein
MNVFNFLAEDGDKTIIRICAAGSSMSFPWQRGREGVLFWDGLLELETQSEGVCYLPRRGEQVMCDP